MSLNKKERNAWIVVRSILLLVAVLFVVYGLIIKQPCDLDAIYLSCRLTGTMFDWIGSILFLSGCVVLSGVLKGLDGLYSPPNSTLFNQILFAAMAVGVLLFWFL